MKNIIVLLFMLPMISLAESKFDIARDIILMDDEIKEQRRTLNAVLKQQREDVIAVFKPSYKDSQEILSMEELLYLEVKNSDLFILDSKIILNATITDLADFLTKDELFELRDIYNRPVFKKLSAVGEKFNSSATSHIKSWQENNERLLEGFKKRSDHIFQMKKEHLESKFTGEE